MLWTHYLQLLLSIHYHLARLPPTLKYRLLFPLLLQLPWLLLKSCLLSCLVFLLVPYYWVHWSFWSPSHCWSCAATSFPLGPLTPSWLPAWHSDYLHFHGPCRTTYQTIISNWYPSLHFYWLSWTKSQSTWGCCFWSQCCRCCCWTNWWYLGCLTCVQHQWPSLTSIYLLPFIKVTTGLLPSTHAVSKECVTVILSIHHIYSILCREYNHGHFVFISPVMTFGLVVSVCRNFCTHNKNCKGNLCVLFLKQKNE